MKELPLSGSETMFRKEPWKKYKKSNNCYAYAVNDLQKYRSSKSVPGDRTPQGPLMHRYTHCGGIDKKVIQDNPSRVYKSKPTEKCQNGYYKIMMFVAPKNKYGNSKLQPGDTYVSIARMFDVPYSRIQKAKRVSKNKIQFKYNCFSHKMGWATEPLLKDSCGKLIKDPRKSCRKYGYEYDTYCSSFCVKNKGVKVGPIDSKIGKNRSKTF